MTGSLGNYAGCHTTAIDKGTVPSSRLEGPRLPATRLFDALAPDQSDPRETHAQNG